VPGARRPDSYPDAMSRVLVAEDDPGISEPLVRALSKEGYDVTLVTDGATALSTARHLPGAFTEVEILVPVGRRCGHRSRSLLWTVARLRSPAGITSSPLSYPGLPTVLGATPSASVRPAMPAAQPPRAMPSEPEDVTGFAICPEQ